jgi:myo-inositol-1(or 4)-monophosphatase
MSALDLDAALERALAIAADAATLARDGWRTVEAVEKKGRIDLLTQYDLRAEALIREGLTAAFPDHRIVGEEGDELAGASADSPVWYVDPIDGTTNFAHGHPFWCVSIGLVVRGVPIVGAIVAPVLGIEWLGWMGGPALRNGEPCKVSDTEALGDALLATGFPYDRHTSSDDNLDAFGALQKKVVGIRRCGSAALDLCFVSDGTYDGYWEKKLRPWDIAAGLAIVKAAGGSVSSMHGDAPDLAQGHVVATNGVLHDALVRELRLVRR